MILAYIINRVTDKEEKLVPKIVKYWLKNSTLIMVTKFMVRDFHYEFVNKSY